jgi:hypothetical protein
MIEKGCTGTKTDSVFLGQYLPFIKLRSARFNAYYLLLTATYLCKHRSTFRVRSARNSPLSGSVDERTLAPTTKWEGKANTSWIAFWPPQRLECGNNLASLPPQR